MTILIFPGFLLRLLFPVSLETVLSTYISVCLYTRSLLFPEDTSCILQFSEVFYGFFPQISN